MATMITEECINCGACEPECPNTAIYQGGVEWEFKGVKHPPLSDDVFYIVPEKCTECVGFYDHEACAAVCPVDVCIPNPDIPETEEVLLVRAKELHPEVQFAAEFPSRFRPGSGDDAPPPQPTGETTAPAAAGPAVVAKSSGAAGGPIEKPLSAPQKRAATPRPEKSFAGELAIPFDEAVYLLQLEKGRKASALKWMVALGQPILGALPHKQKQALERKIDDRRFFTAAGATGLNVLHNMMLYPAVLAAVAVLVLGRDVFSAHLKWMFFFGVVLASIEAVWRMREGFSGRAAEDIVFRAAPYGLPLVPLAAPLIGLAGRAYVQGNVGHDGFTDPRFEDKLERERRYGEVYRLIPESNGFRLEMEFPTTVPASGLKEELGVADEMPDYDYDITLQNGSLIIKGKVTDDQLRKLAAVSPAFPPNFTTSVKLPEPVAGFRHRFRGTTLEVALPRKL